MQQHDIDLAPIEPASAPGADFAAYRLHHSYQSSDSNNLPTSAPARVILAAEEALQPANLAKGIVDAAVYDYHHPVQVAEMFGGCALVGGLMKLALPDYGIASSIGRAAFGATFLYRWLKPVGEAVGEAAQARSMNQIHSAAGDLDSSLGSMMVNSALSMGSYYLGSSMLVRALITKPLAGFAKSRDMFWDRLSAKAPGQPSPIIEPGAAALPDLILQEKYRSADLLAPNMGLTPHEKKSEE